MTDPVVTADSDIVLQAQGVDLVRDGKLLLDQVSVTIRAGEHWALLGPNGAGKSTLLHVMATYAHPTRGQMDILGRRLGSVTSAHTTG
jgi:iron complex transport system ATP-binding protein